MLLCKGEAVKSAAAAASTVAAAALQPKLYTHMHDYDKVSFKTCNTPRQIRKFISIMFIPPLRRRVVPCGSPKHVAEHIRLRRMESDLPAKLLGATQKLGNPNHRIAWHLQVLLMV